MLFLNVTRLSLQHDYKKKKNREGFGVKEVSGLQSVQLPYVQLYGPKGLVWNLSFLPL